MDVLYDVTDVAYGFVTVGAAGRALDSAIAAVPIEDLLKKAGTSKKEATKKYESAKVSIVQVKASVAEQFEKVSQPAKDFAGSMTNKAVDAFEKFLPRYEGMISRHF